MLTCSTSHIAKHIAGELNFNSVILKLNLVQGAPRTVPGADMGHESGCRHGVIDPWISRHQCIARSSPFSRAKLFQRSNGVLKDMET